MRTPAIAARMSRRAACRSRLLLASSSLAALVIGGGAPQAFAAPCAIDVTSGTVASVGTSGNTNCIAVQNATVTGNVTNASPFIVAPTSASGSNGIIVDGASVGGAVVNTGTINAPGNGVLFTNKANASGGISNSGTISAGQGIFLVSTVTSFSGGITNSGTISGNGTGININAVSTFAGGINNSGTIAANGSGIFANDSSTFSGGITNSGTISAGSSGIDVYRVITFAGGITNSGTVTAHNSGILFAGSVFSGGLTNSGMISAGSSGITIKNVNAFAGGIINSGTISAGRAGINIIGVSSFAGGISNGGMISSQHSGIFIVSNSTFSGGIANAGTIAARFTGMFVASSTFSGGITNSGMISAGSAGININTVSVFAGGIANTGTIAAGYTGIYVSANSTFSGGITNSGMIYAHSAAININNVNAFAGGITNSGTLSSSHSSGIAVYGVSTFAGGIANNGTISSPSSGRAGVALDNVSQFSGGIGNGGKIATSHTGIFLSQVSRFSGNVSNAGTISAVTAISIGSGVTFAAGSAIVNSGTITGSAAAIDVHLATSPVTIDQAGGTINGAIKLSSNADVLNISGGAINGNIIGAGSRNTINFAPGAGNSFTYGNSFTGINQVNINSGTVILNGTDVATSFDVNGGTLAGIGIIDPLTVTIHSGAALQPGAPGTGGGKLNIVGSLVFQSAAVYLITINGANASYTSVTGSATLGGAKVAISGGSTVVVGQKYTILTDTGGGLGSSNTFADAVGFDRLRGTLSYDDNDVYVTFKWAPLGPLLPRNAPVNIANTAAAIDDFTNRGGALPAGFQNLYDLSPAELGKTLTQLSGEAATGAERNALLMTTEFLNVMLDPLVPGHGGNTDRGPALGFATAERAGLPDEVARAYAAIPGEASAASVQQRWSAWGSAYGGGTTNRGDPVIGSNNISASAFGFAGGMDYHVMPSTLVGVALAGGGTNWDLANVLGTGRSDALQAGGYGISRFGPAYIAGALSFSNHWFTTNRTALGDRLTSNFIGQSYGARIEGGNRYGVLPAFGVTPYGAVQFQDFHAPAYGERDLTGGGFGLSYAATTATNARAELGARFDALASLDDKPLLFYGRFAWAHDFVANPAVNAAFETLPGGNFTVYGATIPRDTALTMFGAQLLLSAGWSLTGNFHGDFAPGSQSYGGNGRLRHVW